MMNSTMFTTHEAYDALLKAQKATDRFLYQYNLCVGIKTGTVTKFHNGLEEELATLKARRVYAQKKILALQAQVKVLPRFYNLSNNSEVREMIFDFADIVNSFLYESELEVKEA